MKEKIILKYLQHEQKRTNLVEEIARREYHNSMAPFPVYDTDIINDLKDYLMITKKENYNAVPITYCKTCLKIGIKDVTFPRSDNSEPIEDQKEDALVGYCVSCSNTDLAEAPVSEWEEMYEEKYGEKFLSQNK